jgi:CheY-like chemotaxis protein
MNLCTNAAHAMEGSGGNLRVELSQVTIAKGDMSIGADLPAGKYLLLKVQDNGCGIHEGNLKRIFDPYFTTKEKGKGTGLGLAVVHGIVQNYGGFIQVESRLQIGTTFKLYLPTVEQPAAEHPEIDSHLPRGNEQILLVDDEPIILQVERELLENLGYRVNSVSSGMEAINALNQDPAAIDLVITDLTMPKMTGDKLAVELSKIKPGLPIILCTGYSGEKLDSASKENGVFGYICKPIVLEELAKVVRGVLDDCAPDEH